MDKKKFNQKTYWDNLAEKAEEAAVIDPNDKSGYKNKYISYLRDSHIQYYLKQLKKDLIILDFGCGSGSLSKTLIDNNYTTIGIDISHSLLKLTKNKISKKPIPVVRFNGRNIPFKDGTFDVIVTYGVLVYFPNSESLENTLREIYRILKPSGIFIPIEQIARKEQHIKEGNKTQRPINSFIKIFKDCGFYIKQSKLIRYGHFPIIYLIRAGIIPSKWFPNIIRIEEFIGHLYGEPRFDYADVLFLLNKK